MSKTPDSGTAVHPYLTAFQAFSENGAGKAPRWLKERRQSAIDRFVEMGFPTTRQEAWRFTDVKRLATTDFTLAGPAESELVSLEEIRTHLLSDGRNTAVFVNGSFAPSLSSVDQLREGVTIGSLRGALADQPDVMERHLGRYAQDDTNPFTALNSAFIDDGAFVYIPKDADLEEPLQVLFVAAPQDGTPLVWHPRNVIIADQGARASVIETHVALGRGTYWVNAVTEVLVAENAKLDTYRIQHDGVDAYRTATTHSRQAQSSSFSSVTFVFGGGLTRHDVIAVLDGEGAECTLDGLSILRGRQHVDFHTTLEHAKPHCTSWEYFNGVFDDRARGVFNGRIVVQPGAQRTDSKQTNNNLLRSPHARADSQPQLEIYADDVKCTHGATLGPIDDRQLYYLQTRGLDRDAARNLLTYGFCAEILNAVGLEELRARVDRQVREHLNQAMVTPDRAT